MMFRELLYEMYQRMLKTLGHQRWWPAETPFEVCVGAVLTQNTNWRNVERAISNLKSAGKLSPEAIATTELSELEELVRPSGFYKQKAKRLKNLAQWIVEKGGMESLKEKETESLREGLLSISGIGFETADSILLYAFERPVFVVDAYTYRILVRHGLAGEDVDYGSLQEIFMSNLDPDVEVYKEFHALIVEVGKRFCKKNNPKCGGCPLDGFNGYCAV